MTFIRKNFNTAGSQSRAGVVPQEHTYVTTDVLSAVKAQGYITRDNTVSDKDGMLGVLSPNDIISVVSHAAPDPISGQTNVPKHNIIRVAGDGRGPGAFSSSTASTGSGMTAGDLAIVTYTDGTVLRNTIIRINDATGSAVTLVDPGQFDSQDVPTSLTGLAYVLLDGATGTVGTVTIVTTTTPDITVWPETINEA